MSMIYKFDHCCNFSSLNWYILGTWPCPQCPTCIDRNWFQVHRWPICHHMYMIYKFDCCCNVLCLNWYILGTRQSPQCLTCTDRNWSSLLRWPSHNHSTIVPMHPRQFLHLWHTSFFLMRTDLQQFVSF